ncbi:MAG: DUF192 domain-containing protein [Nanoarchaeota archaeon]
MNKYFIFFTFFILIIFVFIYYNNFGEIKKICFEENCFDLEIADNKNKRDRGLMFRDSLCENCGMLIIFEEKGNYKFWMKNTKIPLDIIWINKNLEVIYIAEAALCVTEECKIYNSQENSSYVLEINKGKSKDIRLEVGSKMELRI